MKRPTHICGIPIRKTRYKELGYANMGHAWYFVDVASETPAQVGQPYATKAELLADAPRYAAEYGCEGTTPPVNHERALRNLVRASRLLMRDWYGEINDDTMVAFGAAVAKAESVLS